MITREYCIYCSGFLEEQTVSPEEDVCNDCYYNIFPDDKPEHKLAFRPLNTSFRSLVPDPEWEESEEERTEEELE